MDVVALNSGGMDSLVLLAILKQRDYSVQTVFIDYGQASAIRECEASKQIADCYGCGWYKSTLRLEPWLESSLCDPHVMKREQKLANRKLRSRFIVLPLRNMVLLSIAASYAEIWNIPKLAVAWDGTDYSVTRDSDSEFLNYCTKAIRAGSVREHNNGGPSTEMIAPLLGLSKYHIALKGRTLEVPFEYSWSCRTNGSRNGQPCGRCERCKDRNSVLDKLGQRKDYAGPNKKSSIEVG